MRHRLDHPPRLGRPLLLARNPHRPERPRHRHHQRAADLRAARSPAPRRSPSTPPTTRASGRCACTWATACAMRSSLPATSPEGSVLERRPHPAHRRHDPNPGRHLSRLRRRRRRDRHAPRRERGARADLDDHHRQRAARPGRRIELRLHFGWRRAHRGQPRHDPDRQPHPLRPRPHAEPPADRHRRPHRRGHAALTDATGTVEVSYRQSTPLGSKTQPAIRKKVRVRSGRFRVRLKVKRRLLRRGGLVTTVYSGDARHLPQRRRARVLRAR